MSKKCDLVLGLLHTSDSPQNPPEITVPTAPAVYPAKHVTPSCCILEQSSFVLWIKWWYISSTECSNVENITIETANTKSTVRVIQERQKCKHKHEKKQKITTYMEDCEPTVEKAPCK
ncbi:unnamed protein product, partial [Linum tenue]